MSHRDAILSPGHAATPLRSTCQRWRDGLRCLRQLLADPDATENAIRLVFALDPNRPRRSLARLEKSPAGRRLLRQRPELLARLEDRGRLSALPEGSLGRAYLDHLDRHGLDPRKLVELNRRAAPDWEMLPAAERWWIERRSLLHDLWHVLTGCGSDPVGEATLLPFSWAQLPGWANTLLTLGVGARGLRVALRRGPRSAFQWVRHLWGAWRAGRRAVWLGALPYEEMLEAPLSEVRSLARVSPLLPASGFPTSDLELAPEA